MISPFLDRYYELAMLLVQLDPDGPDFEDEEKVLLLLNQKFEIHDYEGFIALIEALRPIIEAGIHPFDNYIKPRKKSKKKKINKKSKKYPFVQRGRN